VIDIFQKKSFACVVALTLPTLVLLSGLYELFPVPGWVDPMIYVGYFLDPAEQIWRYGPLYYSARVPYIFVGHLFYSVFNPVCAHYATLLFFYGSALGAVFCAAHRLYGRNVAILATWWLGLNPLWVNAVSTGYVDGPAMAFGFVAFACAVSGVTRSRLLFSRASLAASGFFVSLVLIIHPVPGGMAALAVLATCYVLRGDRSAFHNFAYVALGGVVGLTISTIYALQLGAPTIFSFFSHGPMARPLMGQASPFETPLSQRLSGNYWAIAPVALLFLSFFAIRRSGIRAMPLAVVGLLCLISAFAFLALWDAVFSGATLQEHFYVSYLIYGEAILFIAVLGGLQKNFSVGRVRQVVLYLAVIVAAIAPLYVLDEKIDGLGNPIIWLVLVTLGGMTIFLFRAQRSISAVAGMMLLTMFSGVSNAGTRPAFTVSGEPLYKLVFEEVIAIRRVAVLTYLHGRNVFVWGNRSPLDEARDAGKKDRFAYTMSYAGKTLHFNVLDSLAALWVWDRGALGFDMPAIQNTEIERLHRSKGVGSIVVVCLRQLDCDLGVAALNRADLTTSIRASTQVWIPGREPVRVVIVDF